MDRSEAMRILRSLGDNDMATVLAFYAGHASRIVTGSGDWLTESLVYAIEKLDQERQNEIESRS